MNPLAVLYRMIRGTCPRCGQRLYAVSSEHDGTWLACANCTWSSRRKDR